MKRNRNYIRNMIEDMFEENGLRILNKRGKYPENFFRILTSLISLLCFCLTVPAISHATSATISWHRNQEPDIAGYRICYGIQKGQYINSFTIFDSANEPLERSSVIDGLREGQTYYISIRAFDHAGQESDYSEELALSIPAEEPVPGEDGSWWSSWYGSQDWLEVGAVDINHQWQIVALEHEFQNPVVIVSPPTANGNQPCVVRVRNVTPNSFEIRIQEWQYLDQKHAIETISYLVVEAGEHVLPDGTWWQAGTYPLRGTRKWEGQQFGSSFVNQPIVFQTIQSANGAQTVIVRTDELNQAGFTAALQEEERLSDGHVIETVGFLAIDPENSDLPLYRLRYNHEWAVLPAGDRLMRLEEEQSWDAETNHAYEDVGLLLLGDHIFASIQTTWGRDTVSLRVF